MPDRELSDAANVNRRGLLKCIAWAGSGVLWGLSGGVPRSPAPGPMKVPAERLHSVLGVRTVNYVWGRAPSPSSRPRSAHEEIG
jgi:hypothetical protein